MTAFLYKNNSLYCENLSLSELVQKLPTPFYCYSQNFIIKQFLRYKNSFRKQDLIAYALKANSNGAILHLLKEQGAGADIVSQGELFRALQAGIAPQKIVYSGVGKSLAEIDYALAQNIKCFNVESPAELELLQQRAQALGKIAPFSLRLNFDISAPTHAKIATGSYDSKFGIDANKALLLYQKAKTSPFLAIKGVDIHIGSQICDLAPFHTAFRQIKAFVKELKAFDIACQHIDIGGGLGINYQKSDNPPSIEEYAACALSYFADFPGQLICEPGRNIIGGAGAFISKILYRKANNNKNFLVIDGAMNDLIRPTLYDAYQEIIPLIAPAPNIAANRHNGGAQPNEENRYDIVGPICESGDYFAKDRLMPPLQAGDFLAVLDSGAYGASMASNYNSRLLAPEILINDSSYDFIRRPQDLTDLIKQESLASWQKPAAS